MKLIRLLVIISVFYIFLYQVLLSLSLWFSFSVGLLEIVPGPKYASLMAVLLTIAGSIGIARSKGRRTHFWTKGWEEIIGYVGISLYLGLHLAASYIYINWLMAAAVILYFLPDGIDFLFSSTSRELNIQNSIAEIFKPELFSTGMVAIALIIGGTLLYTADQSLRSAHAITITHPRVTRIEPKLASTFDLILVGGTGFGVIVNDKYKVYGEKSGQLEVVEWAPERVIFRLNTLGDPGNIKISREAFFQGKYQIFESDNFNVEFYPMGNADDTIQRRWREQYRMLSKEYRDLINKYPM